MFMDNAKLTCFHIAVIIIWNKLWKELTDLEYSQNGRNWQSNNCHCFKKYIMVKSDIILQIYFLNIKITNL